MKNVNSSEQLNELFTALANAQAEMPLVEKMKTNPFFKSKYADISDMVMATRPALSKNGLSILYPPIISEDGVEYMTCRLAHSSGQWIEGAMKVSPVKTDPQSLGSYKTYLRRYLYQDMTGCITTDEDDDGEQAMPSDRNYANARGPVDKISLDQVEQLEIELQGHSDIKKDMLAKMNIRVLGEIERNKYQACLDRIRSIKNTMSISPR